MAAVSKSKLKKVKCVTPGCTKNGVSHGLCGTCYQYARKLIVEGKTTWIRLGELGLSTFKKKVHPFVAAFEARELAAKEKESAAKTIPMSRKAQA